MKRLIFQKDNHRIIEVPDDICLMDDLKGDCFDPKVNTDIDADLLKQDELKFERRVHMEGTWGYILQKWNPEVGQGWEDVSSCFGFVGQYVEGAEDYDHYIVGEFKGVLS